MKVALLADIHANDLALHAVLSRARDCGVERLLIAGDFVGYYRRASRMLAMLNEWNFDAISGNHEAMLEQAADEGEASRIRAKYGSGIDAARSSLTPRQVEWLCGLPEKLSITVDGWRVLLCHGTPWDRDEYMYPDRVASSLPRLAQLEADIIISGHTHYPYLVRHDSIILVNPGSVGQPRDGSPGACWALWDTGDNSVSLRREPYDSSPLLQDCRLYDAQHPYLASVLTRTF